MKKSILSLVLISFMWIAVYSQVDTISTNIFQQSGKLGIGTTNPSSNVSIVNNGLYENYEKLLDLSIDGIPNSYILFRNNTSLNNAFEPCIHGSNNYPERSGLIIMGNIFKNGDNNDNAIINITPYVDNGLGFENGGYDFPTNRHYFRIRGHKSGFGDKYLFEIDQNGNIGIGTKTPNAKLEVTDGDIYISDIEKGIIMKSPDGQCWRGTLDNFGSLNFSAIECPDLSASAPNKSNTSININVFPNPSKNIINVDLENVSGKKLKFSIVDANGKLQKNGVIKSETYQIDISDLSNGLYTLSIYDKKGIIIDSKQIIKN